MKNINAITITFRCPREISDAINVVSEREFLPCSGVIRAALRKQLSAEIKSAKNSKKKEAV